MLSFQHKYLTTNTLSDGSVVRIKMKPSLF